MSVQLIQSLSLSPQDEQGGDEQDEPVVYSIDDDTEDFSPRFAELDSDPYPTDTYKPTNCKSKVWDNFVLSKSGESTDVWCELCRQVIKRTGTSTTKLLQHLQRHHSSSSPELSSTESTRKPKKTPNIEASFLRWTPADTQRMDKAAAKLIINAALPINIVENESFRNYTMYATKQQYQLPHRTHMTSIIDSMYNAAVDELYMMMDGIE